MGDLKRPAMPGRLIGAARGDHLRLLLLPFVSLASVSAPAFADTTISDDRTTGVSTATVNGGNPDNIIISTEGSITLDAAGAAVTINSDHSVTNSGLLTSSGDNNTTGVLIQGGFTGNFTNSGTIRLDEAEPTDSDSDGDRDGPFAVGNNRIGIWLEGALTGNIKTNSGSAITIVGNDSAGIQLDGALTGGIESLGAITVTGNNVVGIHINAPVSEDVLITGAITATGANATGLDISGAISGGVRLRGNIGATGFRDLAPTDAERTSLDEDDELIGGPAVAIRASVVEGVIVDGVGVENDDDDDRDGILEPGSTADNDTDNDADDNQSALIRSLGSSPAVLISANTNIVLGPAPGAALGGFGFVNRGGIEANGVYDSVEATAVRIEGLSGSNVTIAGGVLNDGSIGAAARKADSTALYVGQGAQASTIRNRNRISSVSTSEEADTAYGVRVALGADVSSFENSGVVDAQIVGDEGSAVAFIDERTSGLTTLLNTGTIFASANAGSAPFTGETVAIDVSANTTGVTLTQTGQGDFNDQDATDDAAEPPVQIIGDIRFGSGADTMKVLAGQTVGAISFGAGADELFIDGGALVAARLSDTDGQLSINVQNGTLAANGGVIGITSATFGAESALVVSLSSVAVDSTLITASGSVSFADGALVTPVLLEGLPQDDSVVFLQAGSLIGAENVERVLTGAENVPWVYNIEIAVSDADPNELEARYALKTDIELFGLGTNHTNERAAFDPVIDALREDQAAAVAFGKLDTEAEFFEAYGSLLPNFSAATAELAITAIAEGQGATANRLASARMGRLDHDSVWLQEIGFVLQRDAQDFGVDYDGHGFGFAAGFDGPLAEGLLLGLSVAFTATEAEEKAREGNVTAAIGQLNAYFGGGLGPIEWDLIGGGGIGKMQSRREVRIGPDFAATSEADWLMYEGHGQAQLGLPLRLGDRFTIRPRASIVYVGLSEDSYSETGGGALDVEVGESTMQRVWADGVIDLSWRFGGAMGVTPRLTLGYRSNIVDDPAERDVHFGSDGATFTLVDEVLGDGGPLIGFSLTGGNDHSTVSLVYEGEFTDTIDRHSLNASLRFRF